MLNLKHRSRGYTITELLITIAILMVLVVAAGRAILNTPPYQVAVTAASATVDLLSYGRTVAMTSGDAVMVRIVGIGNTAPSELSPAGVYIYHMPSNLCGIPAGGSKLLRSIELFRFAEGSMIYKVTLGDTEFTTGNLWLCYRPNGSLNYQDGLSLIPDGEIIFRYIGHNQHVAGPYVRVKLLPFGEPRLAKVE